VATQVIVLNGGAAAQRRWRDALAGLTVLWVGVRCRPEAAATPAAGCRILSPYLAGCG